MDLAPRGLVRVGTDADVGPVADVIAGVKRAEFGAERSLGVLAQAEAAALRSVLHDERAAWFVALDPRTAIVGGAVVAPFVDRDHDHDRDHELGELRTLFLLPRARGQGLGRELVANCLDAARRLGSRGATSRR